jgi:hypothetical protein
MFVTLEVGKVYHFPNSGLELILSFEDEKGGEVVYHYYSFRWKKILAAYLNPTNIVLFTELKDYVPKKS